MHASEGRHILIKISVEQNQSEKEAEKQFHWKFILLLFAENNFWAWETETISLSDQFNPISPSIVVDFKINLFTLL